MPTPIQLKFGNVIEGPKANLSIKFSDYHSQNYAQFRMQNKALLQLQVKPVGETSSKLVHS